MCGRFTSTTSIDVLAETYSVDEVRAQVLPERYNVAPTQQVYAVATRRGAPGGRARAAVRQLGTFRWGLVPSWARDASVGSRMINARAETVADKAAYREALLRRRCIVPADAFYEWQAPSDGIVGGPGERRSKLPYAVRRRDGQPMALAGLWDVWRDPAGGPEAAPLRTAVIITTTANAVLRPIHHRMPVILPAAGWDTWLDPAVQDRAALEALLVPAPDDLLDAFAVSSRVNKADQEGPELLEPLPAVAERQPAAPVHLTLGLG